MRKLLRNLKGYEKETILSPLFKLLEAFLELFIPIIMASIIDTGIANKDMNYITKMVFLMILFGFIGLSFSLTAQYFAAKSAVGFSKNVKKSLFHKIQEFTYTQLDQIGTSSLVTLFSSDIYQAQNGVNLTLRLLLRSPFIIVGSTILAFTINKRLAMIFLWLIPVLALIIFGIMLFSITIYQKIQVRLSGLLSITRDNLSGVRVLRAFGKEEDEIREFTRRNDQLVETQKFAGKISGLMNPLTYVVINLGIVVLLWQGAFQIDAGDLSKGELVALYNYLSQILIELVKFANLVISITKGVSSGRRIQKVLDIETQKDNKEYIKQDGEETIEFQNVGFTYAGGKNPALTDVNFKVKKGQTLGIIGGTGSGKSTLIQLLAGFYEPSQGNIKINGRNILDYSKKQLCENIAMVPQRAILFSGTIEDNLRMGNENATKEEMEKALELAQAKDFVLKKKHGIQAKVEQGGKNFSGGQKQRLTIARAFIKKAKVYILDDSFSALDYATDAALRMAIKEACKDEIMVYVSQRTSSIQSANLILVMDDGKVVGAGTHESLLKDCQVYQEIHYSQYEEEERA